MAACFSRVPYDRLRARRLTVYPKEMTIYWREVEFDITHAAFPTAFEEPLGRTDER
jgi:hypothetical protein